MRGLLVQLLLVMALCASAARGQALGAGSVAPERAGGTSHAWVVLPEPGALRGVMLHLPPRGALSDRFGRALTARAGEASVAHTLSVAPAAIAARDNRVALVYSDSGLGLPTINGRTVLSLGAVQSEPGLWKTVPEVRLDALPSLRADGLLLGFAGPHVGFAALMQGLSAEGADPTRLTLQVLIESKWVDVVLPPAAVEMAATLFTRHGDKPAVTGTYRLVATDEGLALFIFPARTAAGPIAGSCFLADFTGSPPRAVPSATWVQREVLIEAAKPVEPDDLSAAFAGDHLVLAAREGGGAMTLYTQPLHISNAPWRGVASIKGIADDYTVVPLDNVGRVAVLSITRQTGGAKAANLNMTEVSMRTGAVLFDGEVQLAGLITESDYRLIGVLLAWVLGLVVVFVLRLPPAESVHLPDGVSIAEPGRRMFAGVIDLTVALLIAAKFLGVPMADVATLGIWESPAIQNVLLLGLAIAVVSSTLLESFLGRTLGKMLTGCTVIAMERAGAPASEKKTSVEEAEVEGYRTPVMWKALVRTIIKWGLPPVAVFGLLDAPGRHRGDHLAGTAVVVPTSEDAEQADEER